MRHGTISSGSGSFGNGGGGNNNGSNVTPNKNPADLSDSRQHQHQQQQNFDYDDYHSSRDFSVESVSPQRKRRTTSDSREGNESHRGGVENLNKPSHSSSSNPTTLIPVVTTTPSLDRQGETVYMQMQMDVHVRMNMQMLQMPLQVNADRFVGNTDSNRICNSNTATPGSEGAGTPFGTPSEASDASSLIRHGSSGEDGAATTPPPLSPSLV